MSFGPGQPRLLAFHNLFEGIQDGFRWEGGGGVWNVDAMRRRTRTGGGEEKRKYEVVKKVSVRKLAYVTTVTDPTCN